MSKGSRNRTADHETYRDNFDKIFKKKKKKKKKKAVDPH